MALFETESVSHSKSEEVVKMSRLLSMFNSPTLSAGEEAVSVGWGATWITLTLGFLFTQMQFDDKWEVVSSHV